MSILDKDGRVLVVGEKYKYKDFMKFLNEKYPDSISNLTIVNTSVISIPKKVQPITYVPISYFRKWDVFKWFPLKTSVIDKFFGKKIINHVMVTNCFFQAVKYKNRFKNNRVIYGPNGAINIGADVVNE